MGGKQWEVKRSPLSLTHLCIVPFPTHTVFSGFKVNDGSNPTVVLSLRMYTPMSQRSHVQTSTVQRIRDQCRKFLDGTVSVQSSTSASHSYQPQSTVVYPPVPYPSPIVTTLLQAGAPFNLADVVSRAYLRSALNLKRDCEHHIQRVARVWVETSTESGTISSQIQSIHSVFVSQYRQSLNHLAEQTLILVRSKLTFPTRKEGRNAFDKVYPDCSPFNSPLTLGRELSRCSRLSMLRTLFLPQTIDVLWRSRPNSRQNKYVYG